MRVLCCTHTHTHSFNIIAHQTFTRLLALRLNGRPKTRCEICANQCLQSEYICKYKKKNRWPKIMDLVFCFLFYVERERDASRWFWENRVIYLASFRGSLWSQYVNGQRAACESVRKNANITSFFLGMYGIWSCHRRFGWMKPAPWNITKVLVWRT